MLKIFKLQLHSKYFSTQEVLEKWFSTEDEEEDLKYEDEPK